MRVWALIGSLALAGCATGPSADQREDYQCQAWGAAPGTPAYSTCRAQLYQARMQQAAAIMGYLQQNRPAPLPAPTYTPVQLQPVAPKPYQACLKTGETISGLNRICAYNCAGSGAATTISIAEICPLTF